MKNLHILIAEDDIDDGELIVECFEANPDFSTVTWVKNGKELVDFLKADKSTVDIILTDINMPVMNGIEALEYVVQDAELSLIPVFIYSSSINPIYEDKSKELGAKAFLLKPNNLPDFKKIPTNIISILQLVNELK